MGFKEISDADGNGVKYVAQTKPEDKLDLSDSDEVADKLKREPLDKEPDVPEQQRALREADTSKWEEIPKSLENDLNQDCFTKEKVPPDEPVLSQKQENATRMTTENIPASLERPDEFKDSCDIKNTQQGEVASKNPKEPVKPAGFAEMHVVATGSPAPGKPSDYLSEKHVIEGEIRSPFSRENFRAEDSFDTRAKVEFPELNELKSKCVHDVKSMGTPDVEIDRSNKDIYNDEERQYIKGIRDSVDAPDENTIMQKVITVDTGDIHKDLERYLNPRDFNGEPCEAHVTGCVAKAEDAAPFTNTPQECFDNLRLDYPETPYQDPNQSVYVVRYTNGTNYDIPYSKEFDGDKECAAPMTGNAFTGSEQHIVPEYTAHPDNNKGSIVTDGDIYRINPSGTEEKVAYYNKREMCFDLVEKEEQEP